MDLQTTNKQTELIQKIAPFTHYRASIVCFNPNEKVTDLICPMNVKELTDILGYDDKYKLKQTLKGVKVNGQRVFNFAESVKDGRERNIYVNPRIIFAGNGEGLEVIKTIFN